VQQFQHRLDDIGVEAEPGLDKGSDLARLRVVIPQRIQFCTRVVAEVVCSEREPRAGLQLDCGHLDQAQRLRDQSEVVQTFNVDQQQKFHSDIERGALLVETEQVRGSPAVLETVHQLRGGRPQGLREHPGDRQRTEVLESQHADNLAHVQSQVGQGQLQRHGAARQRSPGQHALHGTAVGQNPRSHRRHLRVPVALQFRRRHRTRGT